ncbi:PAAR domain-containing protein [Candidatus Vondammii sp. HM_W22]|uniref:PAAR domain-containing protein n=1 Tax=Candidatus Vondammii sp. HM_W22 TaxID=2687299 RepID=UPI001F134189
MPKVTRKGDTGSGHGCFPSSSAIEGSSNVFINGQPVVRVGDAFAAHGCAVCPPPRPRGGGGVCHRICSAPFILR